MVNVTSFELKTFVSELAFLLCDERPATLIEEFGFERSAGVLFERGILQGGPHTNVDGIAVQAGVGEDGEEELVFEDTGAIPWGSSGGDGREDEEGDEDGDGDGGDDPLRRARRGGPSGPRRGGGAGRW